MLFGRISISMASLMRRSLYLVFVERSLVSLTPGNYPKRNILQLKHGESLKTGFTFAFTLFDFSVNLMSFNFIDYYVYGVLGYDTWWSARSGGFGGT